MISRAVESDVAFRNAHSPENRGTRRSSTQTDIEIAGNARHRGLDAQFRRRDNVYVESHVVDRRIRVRRRRSLLGALYIGRKIELWSESEFCYRHVAGKQRILCCSHQPQIGRGLRTYAFGITDADVVPGSREVKKNAIGISDIAAQDQIPAPSLARKFLYPQTIAIKTEAAVDFT